MENVTTYFELERDATVKWLDFIETLNSSEWDLDEDYERLYSGDAWDKAGASEFWSGIIGLIGMGAVFAFNVGSDTSLIALIGFGAALCAFRIFQGFYRFKKAGAIRRSFMEKRDVLEKEPGWLWRYENFIRPELNTFPDFAQNTFDGVMSESKSMEFGNDQESLIRYWFWVRIVRDRLKVWRDASSW